MELPDLVASVSRKDSDLHELCEDDAPHDLASAAVDPETGELLASEVMDAELRVVP